MPPRPSTTSGRAPRRWPSGCGPAIGRCLGDPAGEIALGPNTHDLVVKLLSTLDLSARPRVVTTDAEFHSLRRQLSRLAEDGLEVVRVGAEPVESLAERVAAEVDDSTALVAISAVLFTSARIVPGLGVVAAACERHGVELLVDAYHALGVVPFPIPELGLAEAWVTGGGYKYLQLGEGNGFLRVPPHGADVRPAVTGWFAEFADLFDPHQLDVVAYGPPATRFASGTYDPASHYRADAVFDFFASQGLTPPVLREVSLHQIGLLRSTFDGLGLPDHVITRDRSFRAGLRRRVPRPPGARGAPAAARPRPARRAHRQQGGHPPARAGALSHRRPARGGRRDPGRRRPLSQAYGARWCGSATAVGSTAAPSRSGSTTARAR